MGFRDAWWWIKLGRALAKVGKLFQKETEMGFDPKIGLKKAGMKVLYILGMGALTGLLGLLQDPEALSALLQTSGVSVALTAAVVTVLGAVGEFLRNRQKIMKNGGS